MAAGEAKATPKGVKLSRKGEMSLIHYAHCIGFYHNPKSSTERLPAQAMERYQFHL